MPIGKLRNRFFKPISNIDYNTWVFTAFKGSYSDNPKAISDYILNHYDHINIIWLVEKKYFDIIPEKIKAIEFGSKEGAQVISNAGVIIDNVYGGNLQIVNDRIIDNIKSYIRLKKKYICGQKIYTTFHGTPLKQMGRDRKINHIRTVLCNDVTMFCGNNYTLEIMRHITFNKVKMVLTGSARNDILLSKDIDINQVKRKLKIPVDKKVVLYAPTYRGEGRGSCNRSLNESGLSQMKEIDFSSLFDVLSKKFGGDWVFVGRFHYHVDKLVDWDKIDSKYGNRIINGNQYPDMAEYLLAADVLITDASSSMFDFAITGKPCFLYFPDISSYENEYGFYTNIYELPFPVSKNYKSLEEQIIDFNEKNYIIGIEELKKKFGYFENGDSCKRIVEYILNDINKS